MKSVVSLAAVLAVVNNLALAGARRTVDSVRCIVLPVDYAYYSLTLCLSSKPCATP